MFFVARCASVLWLLVVLGRPDLTFAVDWALKNIYLSVVLGVTIRVMLVVGFKSC